MSRRLFGLIGLLASAALAGCASTDWKGLADERGRALDERETQMETLSADTAKAVAEAEAAKAAKASLERDNAAARQQAQEAIARAQQWQAEAERLKSESGGGGPAPVAASADRGTGKVLTDLKEKYPGAHLTQDGNIEVPLPSDVTFGPGSSSLTDKGKKSLKGLASTLNGEFSPYMIRIEGHTDAQPLNRTKKEFIDNFGLGSARSLEVVRFLQGDMKIDAKRLMSASRGEQEPVAPNDTPANRSKNRRVEVVIVIPHESTVAEAK